MDTAYRMWGRSIPVRCLLRLFVSGMLYVRKALLNEDRFCKKEKDFGAQVDEWLSRKRTVQAQRYRHYITYGPLTGIASENLNTRCYGSSAVRVLRKWPKPAVSTSLRSSGRRAHAALIRQHWRHKGDRRWSLLVAGSILRSGSKGSALSFRAFVSQALLYEETRFVWPTAATPRSPTSCPAWLTCTEAVDKV